MTRISYKAASANACMLRTLIPCLSPMIAPAAGLCIGLDSGTLLTHALFLIAVSSAAHSQAREDCSFHCCTSALHAALILLRSASTCVS